MRIAKSKYTRVSYVSSNIKWKVKSLRERIVFIYLNDHFFNAFGWYLMILENVSFSVIQILPLATIFMIIASA